MCREHSLNKGDVLCREDQSADGMYIIAMGTIRMDKKAGDSVEEVDQFGSGSYVGEVALVSDEQRRIATGVATEKTFVVELHRKDIEALVDGDPALGRALYRAVAQSLARRVDNYASKVANYHALRHPDDR